MVQTQSKFDSMLKPMISDWKIRSANTEVQNGFNLIQMTDDFYTEKHSTRCVLQNIFWRKKSKKHQKCFIKLRFWIVYYHAKVVLSNKWLLKWGVLLYIFLYPQSQDTPVHFSMTLTNDFFLFHVKRFLFIKYIIAVFCVSRILWT